MGKYLGKVKYPVLKHNDIFLESPFGKRKYLGKVEQHNGVDLQYRPNNTKNTPDTIISIAKGIITKTSYSASRGYYVEVRHTPTIISRYLHMVKGSIKVKVGQQVEAGTELGITGMTGAADGIHVHLAIEINGKYVDPLPYVLGEKTIVPKLEKGIEYFTTAKKYKRYGAYVGVNKVPYAKLSKDDKKKCDNVSGYARTKIGVPYTFSNIQVDNKGNWWGCTTHNPDQKKKHYICIYDKTGYQVK